MNNIVAPGVHAWSPSEVKPLVLNLFGPPRIRYCGEPLCLARRQTRALLYRLGASLEPVSRDELVGLFWPEKDEITARRNLARLVSLVRESLPNPKALTATTTTVCLNPQQVWSDASAFLQLRRRETVSAWQEVVDLYSGPFLSGFFLHENAEYDVWQTTMVEQMRLRCLDALSKLIDYNTACGEYKTAVQYARHYLEIDNLAEIVHRQLIGLYARLGERELAQHQFEACVLMLERELGVEPLPETRAVYDQSLQNCSTPYVVRPAMPVLHLVSGLELPLVGREQALLQLERAYRRLKDGGMILISGEAGVGKSRLMHAFAADQNALVLSGHCYSGMQLFAYHPIVEALRPALHNPLFSERAINPVWLAEAERVLPELRALFPELPVAPEGDPAKGQSRLFEALVQLLVGLASRINVMICLDDLHWADEATIMWLQYLSTRLQGSRVCICATYCAEEAAMVAKLKRSLQRSGMGAEIELEPLSVNAVAALLHAAHSPGSDAGSAGAAATAQRLHAATGGNTFFVLELIRALAEQEGLEHPPVRLPVPATVQATIVRRVEQVSAVARQVLEAAAVLDPQLDYGLLQMTSGRDELEIGDGLNELVGHQLLRDADGGLSFQHALVQQTVYDGLPVWRRRLLHQRAAEALLRQRHANLGPVYASVAAHYAAAGDLVQAANEARRALDAWQNHAFPLRWLANWVLLEAEAKLSELNNAAKTAYALLVADQLRLPQDVTVALEEAIDAWTSNDVTRTGSALDRAVELAHVHCLV